MSSLDRWKANVEAKKKLLETIKMDYKAEMARIDKIISTQKDANAKKRYRDEKSRKKESWTNKIEYTKKELLRIKASKP